MLYERNPWPWLDFETLPFPLCSEELVDAPVPTPSSDRCGAQGSCVDRWTSAACECAAADGSAVLAPDCGESLQPVALAEGAFLAFRVAETHRRVQLLDQVYRGTTRWLGKAARPAQAATTAVKTLSLAFRTARRDGLLLYAASNKDFTAIQVGLAPAVPFGPYSRPAL